MRRVLVMLASAAFLSGTILTVGGCGSKSYEERLAKTLDDRRYQKRLNDNLMEPPKKAEGKYEELGIYVRPPKSLTPAKEFLLVVDPGKFDLEGSFFEGQTGKNLHTVARVKKAPNPKKKAAAPANQGEFTPDVIALVNSIYGSSLTVADFKEISKKGNKYKFKSLEVNDKNVQIYLYGGKTDTYQVALIFEFPKADLQSLVTKIELCLESFAVGNKARRAYAGTGEEEGESSTGPGVAF